MRGIIIRSPDDFHFHPRSGEMLKQVLPYTSAVFPRGVVMGNLPKSIVTANDANAYRAEIFGVDPRFSPLMTVMLTWRTTPEIIKEAFDQGVRILKYIPNNVSTNSEEGVALTELPDFSPVLKMAEDLGMIFSGHWESPFDGNSDFLLPEKSREARAICFLDHIISAFPDLKIVVEHATTYEMIEWVRNAPKNVGATLTVHHAILEYGDVCNENGEIYNPFHYCKPIAKNSSDRSTVIKAMMNGDPKFFFGSDSAPHPVSAKEKIPPAAGIFTAPVALPLLAELFERNGALPKLENFVSRFGAEFYGLPLNEGEVLLRKREWTVPDEVSGVKVFWGGRKLTWVVE